MGMRSLASLAALLAGCSLASTTEDPPVPAAGEENRAELHGRLLEIAGAYEPYGRVDDELRWAPGLCRQPMPSRPRLSDSADLDTHGRKLYYLFAADRAAYLGRDGKAPDAVGQVLVKEAWSVAEVPPDTVYDDRASPVRYLKQDGKLFHAAERAGVFIMYRVAPSTAGTDDGWIYGTVRWRAGSPEVTSAGLVRSCMGCHQSAKKGRLFGIAYQGA